MYMAAFAVIRDYSHVRLCSTRDHNTIGDEHRGIHNACDQVTSVIFIGIHLVRDAN